MNTTYLTRSMSHMGGKAHVRHLPAKKSDVVRLGEADIAEGRRLLRAKPVSTKLTVAEFLAGSRAKAEADAVARQAVHRGRVVRVVDLETIEREARVREQCRTLAQSASYLGYPS